ncbi:MAG: hypothetical protein OIF54_09040 [Cohaesibacter sp.]|nr:hypothetical protein [Cohaesibacter sp.]
MWIARLGASIGKVLLTSLITGAVLAALGITTDTIFPQSKALIDQIADSLELALNWLIVWSIPNIMVGAIIIVPVWLILVAFGPKGSR